MMTLVLLSLSCLGVSAVLSLAGSARPGIASKITVAGCAAAAVFGMAASWQAFAAGQPVFFRVDSGMPCGSFYIGLDRLSAFFVSVILGISVLAAVYGASYMQAHGHRKPAGASWFFFNVLVASMLLVVTARNGFLFLIAWELMSLSSFFLVTFEHEKPAVCRAGFTYLVASHLGTAFLLVFFIMLGRHSGSLDFSTAPMAGAGAGAVNVMLLCALAGFGTKAGLIPFHVWLPEAHPAAPSHVSALMSGVMIKIGIYGLIRASMFLGVPPVWWGWCLAAMGIVSGILGVLFALAQHELKPLLAYHSVENIGIIAMGLGLGCLGLSYGLPVMAVLGFAGALLHVLNHALFKGLLFLGAGAVMHATGCGGLDHLGGLLKKMPWTGAAFLTGAVAISGLPPLNGFISEFLIYYAAFTAVIVPHSGLTVLMLSVIGSLAAIGALAGACFTKAFGVAFLGQARSPEAAAGEEVGWAMRLPMLVLAFSCACIGLFAPAVVACLGPTLVEMTRLPAPAVGEALGAASRPLQMIVFSAAGFFIMVFFFWGLRRRLLSGRKTCRAVTWDCGYARPTARMQYTSSSFPNLLNELSRSVIWVKSKIHPPEGIFPRQAGLATEPEDTFREGLYEPVFKGVVRFLAPLRRLQQGQVHFYVLYIAVTLLALLIWNVK